MIVLAAPLPTGGYTRTVLTSDSLGTRDEVSALIRRDHQQHADVLMGYHDLFYKAAYTWPLTTFMGVPTMKAPTDLWVYHDILTAHRPQTIIETGTAYGGSALWFAFVSDALGLDNQIITIDIEDPGIKVRHPRVQYVTASSLDPDLVARLRQTLKPPVLISLDSEHLEEHVYQELCLYAPLTDVGDWLVVEDTNISWPGIDGGARAGAARYLREHPGAFAQDAVCERYLLTMHPGGWWQRVQHG